MLYEQGNILMQVIAMEKYFVPPISVICVKNRVSISMIRIKPDTQVSTSHKEKLNLLRGIGWGHSDL